MRAYGQGNYVARPSAVLLLRTLRGKPQYEHNREFHLAEAFRGKLSYLVHQFASIERSDLVT
jgi:hypothetical protein